MKKFLELPYPPKELNPNQRLHWSKVAKVKKKYRQDCGWLAKTVEPNKRFTVYFHPPRKGRRDIDNAIASMKAAFDGLSDAWGIDDCEFEITYPRKFSEVVKNGKVRIVFDIENDVE